MRYEPYAQEIASLASISEKETLDYFLLRVFETEEVWGLKEGPHWFMPSKDGQLIMPLWPYKRLAEEAAKGPWQSFTPQAESLEFFIYNLLDELEMDEVMIEIMPTPDKPGCLMQPTRLCSILEGMIESGSYSLDQ